jgi:hypothetical protein
VGKGKRPKAQAKPQIVRAHPIECTSHCNMGCALPVHKEGLQSSVLRAGMCRWAIAPPRCGLLAVEHSREATFIAAAGFAVATLPIENEVARYSSIREQSHTSQAQAQASFSANASNWVPRLWRWSLGSTATASTNR